MNMNQLLNYIRLMRVHQPIGFLLLLWPTLTALWLASYGIPKIEYLIIFTLGTFIMRSAGCVINDFADRDFDKWVSRTQTRPLTQGVISSKNAIILFVALITIAGILVIQLNGYAIAIAGIALMIAIVYPFLKRYTYLPQLGLGIAFAFAVLIVFAAVQAALPMIAWLLFIAVVIWTIAYDTMYAMVDQAEDLNIGIKSTAILFGNKAKWIIAGLQLIFLILLFSVGWCAQLNFYYFISVGIAAILCCYQQYLLTRKNQEAYFQAFYNNHWVGLSIFLGVVTGLL